MSKKVELLAPAGDMQSLIAAINAGADAVYLGGKLFGARAFAKNFDTDELIEALHLCHLHHKKVYLTFNTLIKESEYEEILPFLTPLYENGLDGIIIQDIGLITYLHNIFPKLELHISTQMTVTNWRSARYLYEKGIKRIVPARELSLTEIKEIKSKAPVDIEAFIHGAMCYCYSGQCLFSSFLGGRSGNRGKCAQPCRLPYQIKQSNSEKTEECYPLSLKDMCTIELIPQLIEAGIDSFKIEGRMKSPEYVAGVTSIYRKYIDLYESGQKCTVSKQDKDILSHLYIRNTLSEGYYQKHNGSDMITGVSPSYAGNDDAVIANIHERYCTKPAGIPISASACFHQGEPASLTVYQGEKFFTAVGETVEAAKNRPLEDNDIRKQLTKTGNSNFTVHSLDIDIKGQCFYSVGCLNALRRDAINGLEKVMLQDTFQKAASPSSSGLYKRNMELPAALERLSVSVLSKEQFVAILPLKPDRIYIPADLIIRGEITTSLMKEAAVSSMLFLSLPRIIRARDEQYLEDLKKVLTNDHFSGVLIKNLDELYFLKELSYQKILIADHNLYLWNLRSRDFLQSEFQEVTAPLELNRQELSLLGCGNMELILYGHMPMMVTANCILKTTRACRQNSNSCSQSLIDRYHKELPVYCNCVHCYNEIYNAVPLSLHREWEIYYKKGFHYFRLMFTNETAREAADILAFYTKLIHQHANTNTCPIAEYTTGHSTKGAL